MRGIDLLAEQALCNIGQVSLTTALAILPLLALRKLLRRRYPARALCIVWTVLVVRLLVPVQFSLPRAPVQVTPRLTQVRYIEPAGTPALPDGEPPAPVRQEWAAAAEVSGLDGAAETTCYSAILCLLWAGTALLLFGGQLAVYLRYARRLRRAARAVEAPALLAAYRAERERLGIRRELPLLCSPLADGPMLAGLLRPALLLPEEGLESAPLVLRHELVHYQRRDLWRKLAAAAARSLHWFNPAAYLLTRALYEDIELACDSRVVEGMGREERKRYGMAILNCAAGRTAEKQPLTTCFTSGREMLKTRLGELFATGAKKRGAALLLLCALTVGITGGAVSIGGAQAGAPLTEDEALAQRELTEEAAEILAGAWADGWMGRGMEPVYLTAEMQRMLSGSMPGSEAGVGPSGPRDGVPEGYPSGSVGASSPWIQARAILPDLGNDGAYVVYNWRADASPDQRTMEYVHFAWEDGAWRVSAVDGSGQYGEALDGTLDSAEKFRLLYGNDLGLPDDTGLADGWAAYRFEDPVEAAVNRFRLEGGAGEVTGLAVVEPDGDGSVTVYPYANSGSGEPSASSHALGWNVKYTFADGSSVDLLMTDHFGTGCVPIDWSIDGKSCRTMVDLASQWARGTVRKDTLLMFPLLTRAGAEELIEVQQAYAGGEGDEWYWKHGKYGSSPTAQEYGVFLDRGADTVRIVYALSAGEDRFRESELLRFAETSAGRKIDCARSLVRDAAGGQGDWESIDCTEQEWFAMHYMAEPVAGDLSNTQEGYGYGPVEHRDYMEDPVEMAKLLLHIDYEVQARASLVSGNERQALVRLDFEGGGSAFVTLGYDTERQRWLVSEIGGEDPTIRSAAEFAAAYGAAGLLGPDALETPPTGTGLADFYHLDRAAEIQTEPAELNGRPFGEWYTVTFPDASQLRMLVANNGGGGLYPVDWTVDGENIRARNDLAQQWAAGWGGRDTRLLYPIVSENGKRQLDGQQGDDEFYAENWRLAIYLADTTGYRMQPIGEEEMEIVYTEIGRGFFNHQAVQRIRFTTENGRLRIDGWEDVPFEDGNDYEWYSRYCLPSLEHYTTIADRLSIGELEPVEEQELFAKRFAGLTNHSMLEADLQSVTENVLVSDEQGVERPCCQVILRFTDGSGWLTVRMYQGTMESYGEEIPAWNLVSLTLSDRNPEG